MVRLPVAVPPPPRADYEVVIGPGALGRLGELVAAVVAAPLHAIIADETVADLYGDAARAAFARAGLAAELFRFPAGERHKTRASWAELTDALLARGLGRDGCVVALGGGVTGDLAGFVAATYMRGVALVQVPTTLLAMVDAAVGGKTGVDTPAGKNLVGAFHPPRLVVSDPEVLRTLPEEEYRSGLAEAVKHGAIADRAHLEWIRAAAGALLARDPGAVAVLVQRSVEIKAAVVAADPYETGPRQALNFGHTLGHAIEAAAGYRWPHGYAVAAGMVAEAELGEEAGITEPGTAELLRGVLDALGLPTVPPAGLAAAEVLARTRADKKARRARVRYTLLARAGEVARTAAGEWTFPVEEERVERLLERLGP